MRPAHGTHLPTYTAPISRRLHCSHGLRLAHGTRLPSLQQLNRSSSCSHGMRPAHGTHLPTDTAVVGFPAHMACGLLTAPVYRHSSKRSRSSPCSHGMRPAHGTSTVSLLQAGLPDQAACGLLMVPIYLPTPHLCCQMLSRSRLPRRVRIIRIRGFTPAVTVVAKCSHGPVFQNE